ncbi:hypothetical protein SAMN05421846_11443 [Chryseobacterium taeanense]|uniref:Uncharacterized protein n=1 Tax=Chryseobacterium taeanense TaxID=311334 RepID=A0A1G8NLR8_9FLAO|nr:hypothetical protein SAMN05421846_11443 [Chryseobacterium taeanense]
MWFKVIVLLIIVFIIMPFMIGNQVKYRDKESEYYNKKKKNKKS